MPGGGQLRKAGGWQYSYDGEGNLIKKEHVGGDVWLYEWNDADTLIKVTRPDKSEVSFAYDALGRRLWKQFKNTKTKYVWNDDVLLHEWKEHAITGEKLSNIAVGENGHTTWLFDTDSFAPCGKIKGDKTYSIVTDHLGTPAQMYKEDGSLFWEGELDSYGKVRMEKGEAGGCPFRYQGQYEDTETGLYYNYFRYYAPGEGVYISEDPIGLMGSLSLYHYVGDPNTWIDELGLAGSAALDRALGGKPGDGKQAHHLIPEESWQQNKGFLDKIGLKGERDKKSNGVLLPSSRGKANPGEIIHRGSHPKYTRMVNRRLGNIRSQFTLGKISAAEAKKKVKALQSDLRRKLKDGKGVPAKTCSGGRTKQKIA